MVKNTFNVNPQYKDCPLGKEFKTSLRFEFETGDKKSNESVKEVVSGKSVKYIIEFNYWQKITDSPLSMTILASIYSTASEELITFKEKKYLPLGAKSVLELTLGAGYLYVNGWETSKFDSLSALIDPKFDNLQMPPNFAYNTTVCVQTLMPAMTKSQSEAIQLKLECDGYTQLRQFGISPTLASAVSVQSYLFNLSENTVKIETISKNDKSRYCSTFYVKKDKSIDFDITIANDSQSVIQF